MPQSHKDRRTAGARSRHALMLSKLALVASIAQFGSSAADADPQFEKWSLRPLCALWDGQASRAIVHKVSESADNVDLKRLGEDLFRMRRARRNCELGLIRAACEDYVALIRETGGASSEWRGSSLACPAAMTAEPGPDPQQAAAPVE